MIKEAVGLSMNCPFYYAAKYEGERGERKEPTGDRVTDLLASIQADLMDPKCSELVVGGDSLPQPFVWRK